MPRAARHIRCHSPTRPYTAAALACVHRALRSDRPVRAPRTPLLIAQLVVPRLAERARLVVAQRGAHLSLRVHHHRARRDDGRAQRLAGEHHHVAQAVVLVHHAK
eukprot:3736391-Prymnesium_polylepis.1